MERSKKKKDFLTNLRNMSKHVQLSNYAQFNRLLVVEILGLGLKVRISKYVLKLGGHFLSL